MASNNTTPNLQQPPAAQQPGQQQQPPVQQQQQQQPPNDPNQMSPQQVRDLAAGIQQQQQPSAAQQQQQQPMQVPGLPPIEQQTDGMLAMRLPTGQVYKGRSHAELLAAVATAQINASQRITELNQTNERLQQGIAAITGQPGAQPGQPQFDRAVYMELHAQDPILAQNYLDQHRFGLSSLNDVVPYYTRTFQAADRFSTAETVNQFRILAPDFPGTEQAVNEVMGFMKQNNLPFTAQTLKMVHDQMVRVGRYQPLAPQQFNMPVATQPGNMQPNMQPNQQQQPNINPALYDPNPQGNYSFGPNGFGSTYVAPVSVAVPPTQQPAPQVQAPTGAPQFPAMPQVQTATPMPMPQVTQTQMPAQQPANEGAMNTMDTTQLRSWIESNLQR